jgi:hypothetical protein
MKFARAIPAPILSLATILFATALGLAPARGHAKPQSAASQRDDAGNVQRMDGMPGMDHATGQQRNQPFEAGAESAMSEEHMHMNGHMRMTELRPPNADDQKRADELLQKLRASISKYKDYHLAVADGYQPFFPNVKQPIYHFTNWDYGYESTFTFDPEHPTSLLYKKLPNGWQLVGAMYTAPRGVTAEELDGRVPLSVARWHEHVNICMPPRTQGIHADWTQFGFGGSIRTAAACREANGRFYPVIFGWMVHIYPFEQNPQQVWAR